MTGPGPAPDEDGLEPEGDGELCPSIADPRTGLSRLLAERCLTCIMRAGDPMFLGPERTAAFIREALDGGTYVICHDTYDEPAICRGFFDAYRGKTLALRILQAYRRLIEVPHPAARAGEPGRTAAHSAADTATNTAPAPRDPPRPPAAPQRPSTRRRRPTTTAITDTARNTGTRRATGAESGASDIPGNYTNPRIR
jgi:hypothetical protein